MPGHSQDHDAVEHRRVESRTALSVLARRWAEIHRWVASARKLHRRMSEDSAAGSDPDLMWSLVGYVEYAGEAIKAFDRASGGKLLPLLGDIPLEDRDDRLSWRAIIRMRDLLAHSPDKIDHEVVHRTVQRDFPILEAVCESVAFHPHELNADDDASLRAVSADLPVSRTIIIFMDTERGLAVARRSPGSPKFSQPAFTDP